MTLSRSNLTMICLTLLLPQVAAARTAVAVVAASPKAGELRDELEQKLIHTDRYTVVPVTTFTEKTPACPELPRPEYILSASVGPSPRSGKTAGKVRVYDCTKSAWLAGAAEAASAKTATLASNLKDDLLALLPFSEKLELNGETPCIAGGKSSLIRPGKRLWWYDETGRFLGRWIVTEAAPADGCAKLAADYRVTGDIAPMNGQILTDRPPSIRAVRTYGTPALGRVVRDAALPVLEAEAAEIPAGWVHGGSLPVTQSAWIADLHPASPDSGELTVCWNATLSHSRDNGPSLKSGYRLVFGRSGWRVFLHNGKGKEAAVASGKSPRPSGDAGAFSLRIVHDGRLSELYVDDRFVIGIDDDSLSGGELYLVPDRRDSSVPFTAAVYSAKGGNQVQPVD